MIEWAFSYLLIAAGLGAICALASAAAGAFLRQATPTARDDQRRRELEATAGGGRQRHER